MFYGHASWIAVVIFGGMFAMRALSSQRRRGRRPGPGTMGSSFTDDRSPAPPGPAFGGQGTGGAPAGVPPGWFTDPFCRHDQRFWSGSAWTEHISDDGVPGTDPPPDPAGREAG